MNIDGKAIQTVGRSVVVNPATKQVIATVPVACPHHLDDAVTSAQRAFLDWSQTPSVDRQVVVAAMGDRLEEHTDEFVALLIAEQGKPRAGAEWEVFGSIAWLREIAKQSLSEETVEDTAERKVVSRHTPLGVVAAIVPWNFPILLSVWKIAPALVAGNAVILKPSPFTPLCGIKLVDVMQDLLPPGVLSVLSGDDEPGNWMTRHPGIAKIAFTGSTETGRHVMASAAGTVKRVTLELGGDDPAIVMPDVDPKKVAPLIFGLVSRTTHSSAMPLSASIFTTAFTMRSVTSS